jgi:hypothetical protein
VQGASAIKDGKLDGYGLGQVFGGWVELEIKD